jgi:DNA-binding response OmpR family regulator
MPHILLIEDDDLLRRLLRIYLGNQGYVVTEARTGAEGLTLQCSEPADLVLTDILMPGKDGLEVVIELRRKYPKTKLIAMSGGGRGPAADYLRMATRMGADHVLGKPFSMSELSTALIAVLGAKSA